jgi:glycosyltransferase involved in cell wall biosynthesis
MSLSIWYVSKYVSPPGCGSAGVRGYFLMRELAQVGHKVTIITSDSNHLIVAPVLSKRYLIQKADELDFCWVRTFKYHSAKSYRRILSWLHFEWRLLFIPRERLNRPDIVIVSSLSLLTILNGLLLRALYGCPLIFEVRDIWPLTLTEEGGFNRSNMFVALLGLLEYVAYRYSEAIVGTMPNLGKHVENVLGCFKETHCIPMGVDESSLSKPIPLSSDYLNAYFPAGKFIVAHVGSIGITNALEAFFECADLMKDLPNIHFLAIGSGGLRHMYLSKYSHLSNLSFPPRIPKDAVQSALSHCDLLYFSVHSSKVWDYGQSLNKVVDYMLAGKPVVASYSGYPSMINEACCGSFVPAGNVAALRNEILRFYGMSEVERQNIGARGRTWILGNRRYQKLAADYLEIMLKLVNTKRCF